MKLRRNIKRIIVAAAVLGMLFLLGFLAFADETVDFTLDNAVVAEGLQTGATVGQFSLADNGEENPIYSLPDDTADNQLFYIDGNLLLTGDVFDYEILSSYSIVVDVIVDSGAVGQESFVVMVENKAPSAADIMLNITEDIPQEGTLADTSGDATSVLYTLTGTPVKGIVSIDSETGDFVYTPNENANGTDSFAYTVSDGELSASATVSVYIQPVNDSPVCDTVPSVVGTMAIGSTLNANAGAWSDASDGIDGTLSYAYSWQSASDSNGLDIQTIGAGTTYVLTQSESRQYIRVVETVTDTDSTGTVTEQASSVWLYVGNNAPVITEAAPELTTPEDTPNTISLHAEDADGDTLTWSVTGQALSGEAVITSEGVLTYTPGENYFGSDSITVAAEDEYGGQDAVAVTVTVTQVNDAPVNTEIPAISGTAHNGQSLTADDGSWNDTADGSAATALSYSYQWQSADTAEGPWLDIEDAFNSSYTLTTMENGKYVRVKVTCTDSDTYPASAEVYSAAVGVINAAPEILQGESSSINILEDEAAASLLLEVADSDGDGITWTISTAAILGTAAVTGDETNQKTITYTPYPDENGQDSFVVTVSDGNGGTDTITVAVTITAVNDVPVFTVGDDQLVNEDCGAQSMTSWAASVSPGAANETDQALEFTLENDNNALFSVQPAVSSDGTLTYTPADNANGSATVTVCLSDDEGTDNGGADTTATQTFTITVTAVNDAPSFTKGNNQTDTEDDGVRTVENWATAISSGPDDESGQIVSFNVTNNNNALFSVQPAVSSDGALTYTLADNANGTATVTVSLTDDGGTVSSGDDTSDAQTFTITVTAVNDVPVFTAGGDQTVNEDCGAQSVSDWVSLLSPGASNETDQILNFTVENDNNTMFSVQPAISSDGTLTYTPADNANGSATVTVCLSDDGGTANGGADTTATQTFAITVTAVNDAPSFTKGNNQTDTEDDGVRTVENWATAISSGPDDESGQIVSFNVTNNNNALFSVQPAVSSDGTLSYTLADNANGSATVTVSLTDDGGTESSGDDTSDAQTFTITVTAVNDIPTISGDEDLTTDEDTPYEWDFTIGDVEDDPDTLTITYTTDSTALLPKTNMALGGEGSARILTLTPTADRSGSVNITVTVKDSEGGTVTLSATLTVTAVNDAPVLSDISDRTVDEDTSTGKIGYSISDVDSDADACTVTVTSDNEQLVPNDSTGIVLGGSGENRTITITPSENQSGTANITVTVDDNSGSADATDTATFTVTVEAVNDAPVISAIDDQVINEDGTTGEISFTVTDVDNVSSELTVTAATNNTAMIPRANIALGGDGETRTITITPVADDYGTANITVTVKDSGGKLATETFRLTVTAVNDAPTLTAISSQSVDEDTTKSISAYVADIDNDLEELTLTATASTNTALLPLDNISVTGSTGTRTVTMTPADDLSGSTDITLTLTDGDGGTVTRTFTLTVNAVNDLPTFTPGVDVTVLEDCGSQSVSGWATNISTGAAKEDQTLTFLIATDNDDLFSVLPAISAETGELTFTPAANANGEAVVTTRLQDDEGGLSAVRTFTITVTPVNDTPVGIDMTVGLDTDEDQNFKGALRVTDVDGDELTYELVSGETHGVTGIDTDHGSVSLNSDTGTFIYTPSGDYYGGTDTFSFRAYDGTVYSDAATVTIVITGVNDAPVASSVSISVDEDNCYTGSLNSVTDVDGPSISYVLMDDVSHGSLQLGSDGSVTYTPNSDFYGTDRFTYRAYDGYIYSNTATVTITVNADNDAPTALDQTIYLDEGQTLNGVFKASDKEWQALTYSVISEPSSGTLTLTSASTGAFTYTPADMGDADTVTVTFTFRAEDTAGATDTAVVTVIITNVNNAPVNVGSPPLAFTVAEDGTLTGNVYATDTDGDALTYSIVSGVSHGTITNFDSSDGSFTYTPNSNFNGMDRFTFEATDGALYTSIYMANITVTAVNDIPVAYAQLYYTDKNTAIEEIILVGYDADGDSLTYQIASNPSNGTLADNGDGTYTYTPTSDYTGTDSFTYTAADSEAVSAEATVSIRIYGDGESGGLGYIANQTMPQDTTKEVALTITDITVGSVAAVSSNTWLLDGDGISVSESDGTYSLVLTPNSYRTGRTVITVTVTDSDGGQHSRSFILTVTRVNYTPTAADKALTIDENTEMYEFVVGSDLNGDALTYAASQPDNGTLTFSSDGTFHYVPDTGFSGADSFTYTVTDIDAATSAAGTVSITVRPVYVPPTADSTSIETDEDTMYSGTLTGSETHDGALTYYLVSTGNRGTAEITDASAGTFTYTPGSNKNGTDVFTFKVMGPTGLYSNIASVTVTINPINDAPTAVVTPVTTYEDQAVSGYLEGTDVETSALTFALVETDGALTKGSLVLNEATGYLTYTPDENENGTDYFYFTVNDGTVDSDPVQIEITITAVNDAPTANDCAVTTDEDTPVTDSVSAFYSDVDDGDTQTFTVIQSPSKGTIVFNDDGTYTYAPAENANGTDYFTFRTQDSGGLNSNVALVTVTITPVNDAPVITAEETWTIDEDSSDNSFSFSVSDIEDADGTLTLSASWDETAIASVVFGGSGDSRTMIVTPVDDFQSDTEIIVTVTDSGTDGTVTGNVKTDSTTVTVTVAPVNDTPTINGQETNGSALSTTVTIDEDTSTDPLGFTVDDEESGADGLTITAASSNTTLVPVSGITFGGEGGSRTVTVTPGADMYGTVRITVYVSDGNSTRNAYFYVNVLPVNDAPVVTPPDDQTIPEDGSTEILYYTVSDIDNDVTDITMTASSSDESKISGISLEGNGAERTVKIVPAANASGDVTITLTADDGEAENNIGTNTFVVHITPVNDAPTITALSDQEIEEDSATGQITVTIDDIDNESSELTLSAISGNTTLIDPDDVQFGTNAETGERWMILTPNADANGSGLITIRVTDSDGKYSQKSFTLTVTPVNDAPTISAIADQTILEDTSTNTITFTVDDIDNDVTTLTVTGTADGTVIPDGNIVIVGNGAERTVKITPAADQNGDIEVTLTVSDPDGLTDESVFTVRITPVNDAPSYTPGSNQQVLEDCGAQTVTDWATDISKGPDNESGQNLSFSLGYTNTSLFADGGAPGGGRGRQPDLYTGRRWLRHLNGDDLPQRRRRHGKWRRRRYRYDDIHHYGTFCQRPAGLYRYRGYHGDGGLRRIFGTVGDDIER